MELTKLTLAQILENVHANGREAFSRLENREEFNAYYTTCLLIAEADHETDTPSLYLELRAEAYKDMGTEDPEDDEYLTLHESTIPYSNLEEFKTLIKKLSEVFNKDFIHPVIPDYYVACYGFPAHYSIEDLIEILDDTNISCDWSLGGGFGICIYEDC